MLTLRSFVSLRLCVTALLLKDLLTPNRKVGHYRARQQTSSFTPRFSEVPWHTKALQLFQRLRQVEIVPTGTHGIIPSLKRSANEINYCGLNATCFRKISSV